MLLAVLLMVCVPALAGDDQPVDPPGEETESESTEQDLEFSPGATVTKPTEEQKQDSASVAQTMTTVTQSLAADSGVAVQTVCTNCNNADLSVAGLGNEHIVLTCDGMPVPSGLPQIYLLSVMPATMIDKVAVEKGASESKFMGRAVGGGIELQRRQPTKGLQLNTSADVGSYDSSAFRLDMMGQVEGAGAFGVGSLSDSASIDANEDGWADLPEFERRTVEAGLEFEPARKNRLRFAVTDYKEDQLDGPGAAWIANVLNLMDFTTNTEFLGYNRENVQLERRQYDGLYDVRLGDGSRLHASGLWAQRDQDIQETEYPLFVVGEPPDPEDILCADGELLCPSYFINERQGYGGANWTKPIGLRSRVGVGVSIDDRDFEVVDVRFNRANLGSGLPPDFELKEGVLETGAFAEGSTSLGSKVDLSLGARYVNFEYTDNEDEVAEFIPSREAWLLVPVPEGSRVIPRATLTYKPTEPMQFRFSAGRGYRAPDPTFDKVCCGRRYRSNRGMRIEDSISYGFELGYQPDPRVRVGASYFYTDFDDLIVNMATLSNFGSHTYQNVNVEEARAKSATVDGSFQTGVLTTKISYTWIQYENTSEDDRIIALVDRGSTPEVETYFYEKIPYTVNGRGAISFAFGAPLPFNFNINAQYTGTMGIQVFDWEDILSQNQVIRDELFDTDPFWLVNMRFDRDFSKGIGFYLGVDNITDVVQDTLGIPFFDFNWGALRGRYFYGGLRYTYAKKS